MPIALRITDNSEAFNRMLSCFRRLAAASVDVGLIGGSMADRAAQLEHGSPAMNVPGRPFFQNAVHDPETVNGISEAFGAAVEAALEGDAAAVEAALEEAGRAGVDGIHAYFDGGKITPPNAPITVHGGWMRNRVSGKPVHIPGKGFNKPGYDTGALYHAFSFEVK